MHRRDFLLGATASLLSMNQALASAPVSRKAHVVVVGGGFGGATAAKYLRVLSRNTLNVTLVEPRDAFVSLPLSNLVVGGSRRVEDLTVSYDALAGKHGIARRRVSAQSIDIRGRQVTLSDGATLTYDRLVLSPGVSLDWQAVSGLDAEPMRAAMPAVWTDASHAATLHAALRAMPEGGVFAITIPEAPLRCPPAPYERATQVAHWLSRHNPRAKVLIFDANSEVLALAKPFQTLWAERFASTLEYHPQFNCTEVAREGSRFAARFEMGEQTLADVLNVIPPMRAGDIARQSGLASANGRWCEVDFLSYASKVAPDIHVLGDAIQIAPVMPKSGHTASQHAKVCAAAIVAELAGRPVNPAPVCASMCFSFVSDTEAMHIAGEHHYDPVQKTMLPVAVNSDVSTAPSREDFARGLAWSKAIWADMLG